MIEEANGQITFVGNRTECALLMLVRSWGEDYHQIRQHYLNDMVKVCPKRFLLVLIMTPDLRFQFCQENGKRYRQQYSIHENFQQSKMIRFFHGRLFGDLGSSRNCFGNLQSLYRYRWNH